MKFLFGAYLQLNVGRKEFSDDRGLGSEVDTINLCSLNLECAAFPSKSENRVRVKRGLSPLAIVYLSREVCNLGRHHHHHLTPLKLKWCI